MSYPNNNTSYGEVKKSVLDSVQAEASKGKKQFTYTEIHYFILDATIPGWRTMYSSEKESHFKHRGYFTSMICDQERFGASQQYTYNCLCSPNRWDSRHLVKIKRGLYEFKA